MTRGDSRAEALRDALRRSTADDPGPLRFEPCGGGCINQAARVRARGRDLFVKWNDHPLPRQFEAEAAGLGALRDAAGEAGATALQVPEVVAFDDGGPGRAFLALAWVDAGAPGRGHDEALGRGLAGLHRRADPRGFGFELDGYCGATPQPNPWTSDWVEFYRRHRLEHQLALARGRGLPGADAAPIARLLDRLPDLLDASDRSALIHGDLWSGNVMTDRAGGPTLVDPAAHFAHREAELGMMALFGGFSARVFDAYHEAWPLREGWRERLPLYSLYHVLNHYNLFGGSYGSQAATIARRFVGDR